MNYNPIISYDSKEVKINVTAFDDCFVMVRKGNKLERDKFKSFLESTFERGISIIEQGGTVKFIKVYDDDHSPNPVEWNSYTDIKSYQELFKNFEKIHKVLIISK